MIEEMKTNKPKKISWYKERAWKAFSEFIRKRGADENGYTRCYTCGVHAHWKQLQAGHAIPGRNNAVLLDHEVVRPQCAYCNGPKNGQQYIFVTKLIIENGDEWWLKKLAESNRSVKISRAEYEELTERFAQGGI